MERTGRKPYSTTEMVQFGLGTRRLSPPDCLNELQRQSFINLVTSCPAGQFRRCDLPLLARWSELDVLAATAAFHLQADGAVTADRRLSPWFQVHRACTRELRALSQRLQLGPRGRSPRAPKTLPGSVSYYETAALGGDDHDGAN